jgi:ATP-binding cassette subfamily B protein
MGFFSSLAAEKYDRQYSDRELVIRLAKYFLTQKRRLVIIGLMIAVMSGIGASLPIIVARGIDIAGSSPTYLSIGIISGLILGLGVMNWLANWLRRRLTMRTIADVIAALASEAFSAAAEHDLSFYDEFSSGRIVSRITSDTREFGNLVVLVTDLISQVSQTLILSVVLLTIDVKLSLLLFAIVPVVFVLAISFRRLARRVTQDGMRAMANVNSTIKETVSGITVAKNFRQESSIFSDFDDANQTSYRVNVKRGLVLTLVFPTLNALGGIASALLVYFGGLSAIAGVVSAGAWYLFIQSQDRFMFPIMNLSSFWTQVQSGLSAAERVFALIDADHSVIQKDQQKVLPMNGRIEFKHVDFHYKDEEEVLEDFNLHIKPGENVAFVGHTGAGKSSIIKLIARFYEFQEGDILLDGQDIRTFDLTDYRRQLGIVSQVPFLFSGTVAENIRYGRPDVSNTEIENIAHQIGNGDWLHTLPDGLETEVGERGSMLSMGQRQLVALMRVLVQRPAIFILDEATASIDPFTEWQIQQALQLVLSQSTSILVAHRLSTVKSADRIIVIRNGKIIEEGNHQSLLQNGGHYAELYNTYFRHQSLEYVEESRSLATGRD